jgi:hypothetical protein
MKSALTCLEVFVGAAITVAINMGCTGVPSINPVETWVSANGGAANTGGANVSGTSTGELSNIGTGGVAAGGAHACSSNQDCPSLQICGYEADPTCSIQAHCVSGAHCNFMTPSCGCDGSTVTVICGVASKPFTGLPCEDAGIGGNTSNGEAGGAPPLASGGWTSAGGSSSGELRIPQNHRAAGSTCSEQRAPGSVSIPDACYINPIATISCVQDSDCTAGTNGRCVSGGPIACHAGCSYDACFSDSDCPSDQLCECRSVAFAGANWCIAGGNCRIDADCSPGSFCSPSLIDKISCVCPSPALCGPDNNPSSAGIQLCGNSCGQGYFCHTPQDSCIDDSDCGSPGSCAYDQLDQRWACYSWEICQ